MNIQQHLKGYNLPFRNLIDEITSERNISDGFDYVVGHLESNGQRERIRQKKESYCECIQSRLSSGEFIITNNDFRTIEVTDGPKHRSVQAPTIFHRIGCHSVMVPVERVTYPTLITNTAASIKGRGMHWLHNIIEEDLLADPEGMKYYYQCDIRHYYDSISQEIMKGQIRGYIEDDLVLKIIDGFITLLPEGLSKGLRASQCLANLHLNEVDHAMCEVCEFHDIPNNLHPQGVERRFHYYRYCDDIVFFASEKKTLWKLRDYLCSLLATLGLEIKPNEAVRPITEGLDYLGYVTFADDSGEERAVYSRIRKRTKQKFARRIKRVKSRRRRQSLIGSFFGMAAHGDCRHLLKKLIKPEEFQKLKHKRKMKDLGEIKIAPATINGKKNFRGNKINPRELDKQPFIVVSFERDLVPRREKDEYQRRLQDADLKGMNPELVAKPKTKYLCQIIFRGELRKMWTGDRELWNVLDQLEAANELPCFMSVEMDYTAQYPKANFVSAKKYGHKPPSEEELNQLLKNFNLK